jgi:DNA-binding transcriptional LysR family regulator
VDIPWEDLQLFLAVAEARSLSAAARVLKLGQPTLSRRMALLEERLGDPLFVRRTDGVTPTALAERLLPAARRMAEWAGEAERAAAGRERSPEGRVRIAAPPGVAFDFLAPLAGALRTRAPGVRLEVLAGVEFVSLARGEAELAIRSRAPSEHDLVGLAEIEIRAAVYVARSYGRRLPRKVTLADLDWIAWGPPHEQTTPNPQLAAMLGERFRPVFTSNDYLVQLAALEAGVGAMLLGDKYHRFSRLDRLQRLPIDLGPAAVTTFHLVAAKRMADVPRIRSVVDAIFAALDESTKVRRP